MKLRINQLMIRKMSETGELISLSDVADATGFTRGALYKWSNNELSRLDADTAVRLTEYFGCTLDELVELRPAAAGVEG